jgi:FtsZ-binding cell division protein ZapB
MADVVDRFYARTNGQAINSCGGIKGQCVAGVQSYTNVELGIGGCPAFPVAGAKDMFGTRSDAFTWVRNTPSGVPPRGAIMVWNGNVGGGWGHTGVVVSANVNNFNAYQQNDPYSSGMHVKAYDYNNVIGWAIPKGGQLNPAPAPGPIPTGGDIVDTNSGKELYRTGLHREAENDGAASQWNGRKTSEALAALRTSDEWKSIDAAIKSVPALQKQVTELNTKVNTLGVENIALKKQNEELKAQLAAQGEDSINLNALGKLLKWFIQRLGLSK